MHGAGNDFVVIDNRKPILGREEIIERATALCDRRFGIGADGVLSLEQPDQPEGDYTMFYRNADGSDAGMCGNGARCLALFASRLGMGSSFTFDVHGVVYRAEVTGEQVTVSFPIEASVRPVKLEQDWKVYQTHTGTEHIVIPVSKRKLEDVEWLRETGALIREHELFNPPGTNVNFVSAMDSDSLRLQTYERGVEGLTLACGTGAIASAIVWHFLQQSPETRTSCTIHAPGGVLQVDFSHDSVEKMYSGITLTGPARITFEGTWIDAGTAEWDESQ